MKDMKRNEDAVSPVIGVILMVVITVIIAAIIAVFAFGIGSPAKTPEVNLKYKAVDNGADKTVLTISHEGGDALILKDEKMTVALAADETKDAIDASQPVPKALALDATAGPWQGPTVLDTLAPGQFIQGELDYTAAKTGTIVVVSIMDVPTGQIISKTRVVVQ